MLLYLLVVNYVFVWLIDLLFNLVIIVVVVVLDIDELFCELGVFDVFDCWFSVVCGVFVLCCLVWDFEVLSVSFCLVKVVLVDLMLFSNK